MFGFKCYVLGYIFSPDLKTVYLLRKKRPANQKGKLNGFGGKIEPGETPAETMAREGYEECGFAGEWIILGSGPLVFFTTFEKIWLFYAVLAVGQTIPVATEDQTVEAVAVVDLATQARKLKCVDHLPRCIWRALYQIAGDVEMVKYCRYIKIQPPDWVLNDKQ